MSTTIRSHDGGHARFANRWYDAGYAAEAPGSVTLVYGFLCRWADNATLESAQPMRLIAAKCGLTENVARKAIRTLEEWGVISRESGSGQSAKNNWTLNPLHPTAPEYPHKTAPKESAPPAQSAPPQSAPPYQTNEIKESDKSDSGTTESATTQTASKRKRTDDELIVDLWADECNGGKWPVEAGTARKHAKKLSAAGFDVAEARELMAWLRGLEWRTGGITVGLMASQADSFRAAKREGKTVNRKADSKSGQVYG
jgi:hypothetical protein